MVIRMSIALSSLGVDGVQLSLHGFSEIPWKRGNKKHYEPFFLRLSYIFLIRPLVAMSDAI